MRKIVILSLVAVLALFGAAHAMEYNEAPMLAERVASGELPPVEERLPYEPKVMPAPEEIGQYGGTIRKAHSWVDSNSELAMMQKEFWIESYPRESFDAEDMSPNVLQDFSHNEEGTEFTFTLRKGMRWSDGYPVTTEDVRFMWEDVLENEDLTSVFPGWLRHGGERAQLEIIDEYTFKLTFAAPFGILPVSMQSIGRGEYNQLLMPSHYMKQFHIDYTSMEDLLPLMDDEGLDEDEWYNLFHARNTPGDGALNADIGFPVLYPWITVDRPSPGVTIFERNPYYFKVDEAGNQLPYVDRLRFELVQDQEMITMKVLAGEVDFEGGAGGLPITNLPIYRENEEQGGYETRLLDPTTINTPVNYFLNRTHDDLVWREIVNDPRFSQALSLGINREEINQLVFFGMGEPIQGTDVTGSTFWEPEFSEAYIEYDPDRANQLLDEMGLDQRRDGWRLRPDGEFLRLPVEFFEVNPNNVPVTELVVEYWRDLGIRADMRVIEPSLWWQRQQANETVMSVWHEDNVRASLPFFWYVPHFLYHSYGPLWTRWYNTEGRDGEEPPEHIMELFALYETVMETTDNEERIEAGKEILRAQAHHLFQLGTVGRVPAVLIANRDLRNLPDWAICTQWGMPLAELVYFEQ